MFCPGCKDKGEPRDTRAAANVDASGHDQRCGSLRTSHGYRTSIRACH